MRLKAWIESRKEEYIKEKKEKYNKRLQALLEEWYIDEEIKDVKKTIEQLKSLWYFTVVVCLTWDLTHAWHIQYINMIKEKISDKFNIKKSKIAVIVWIEREERTIKRKWKKPIYDFDTRKYIFENIKWVHKVFSRNVPDWLNPSDLMLFIKPDAWVSHEEYFNFSKYLRVSRKMKYWTDWVTKAIIINYQDPIKYQWFDIRKEKWLSTTEIVRKMLINQADFIAKKFKNEIIDILLKIDFRNFNS